MYFLLCSTRRKRKPDMCLNEVFFFKIMPDGIHVLFSVHFLCQKMQIDDEMVYFFWNSRTSWPMCLKPRGFAVLKLSFRLTLSELVSQPYESSSLFKFHPLESLLLSSFCRVAKHSKGCRHRRMCFVCPTHNTARLTSGLAESIHLRTKCIEGMFMCSFFQSNDSGPYHSYLFTSDRRICCCLVMSSLSGCFLISSN